MGKPPEFGLKAPRWQIYWVRSAAALPNEFERRHYQIFSGAAAPPGEIAGRRSGAWFKF